MIQMQAKRSIYGKAFGKVRAGASFEVDEAVGAELERKGLATKEADLADVKVAVPVAPEAKQEPAPLNKQEPAAVANKRGPGRPKKPAVELDDPDDAA